MRFLYFLFEHLLYATVLSRNATPGRIGLSLLFVPLTFVVFGGCLYMAWNFQPQYSYAFFFVIDKTCGARIPALIEPLRNAAAAGSFPGLVALVFRLFIVWGNVAVAVLSMFLFVLSLSWLLHLRRPPSCVCRLSRHLFLVAAFAFFWAVFAWSPRSLLITCLLASTAITAIVLELVFARRYNPARTA
jgi:hypothetical protein